MKDHADFHRKAIVVRRFLLTLRPISYIMLTKKFRWILWVSRPKSSFYGVPSLLLLVGGIPGFELVEFVVDVLLQQMLVCADHAAPVHKNRRCAADFE